MSHWKIMLRVALFPKGFGMGTRMQVVMKIHREAHGSQHKGSVRVQRDAAALKKRGNYE